jgi:hypothetical protein
MCFLWSLVELTCLSFASQRYAALFLPACMVEQRAARAGSRCAACHFGVTGLLQHIGLRAKRSYPFVRLLSLPIWSALGSPCGVGELGNRDLMGTRMSGIAYERK